MEKDNEIVEKLGTILINNGWNNKNEKLIISIGENSASYKWMHEKSAQRFEIYNKIFTIVMILLSTVLSIQTVLVSENEVVEILRDIITYIITVMTIVSNFINYDKLIEKHLTTSGQFSNLYHDIQQQMCLYRQDRKNAINYISETLKVYDSLILQGPIINSRILRDFKIKFANSDISKPGILDRIEKIEVIPENIDNHTYNQLGIMNNININDDSKLYREYDITDNDIKILQDTTVKHFLDYEKSRWKQNAELD